MKYYVNINAFRDGDGSEKAPFRHIQDAASVARPGDEVLVAPGLYRESVDPKWGGTEEKRITYRSLEPLGAVISGAEALTGWIPYEGSTWVNRVKNSLFGDYNPYTTFVGGDWYFAPQVRHTGAVYCNDQVLYEATSLEECLRGQVYASSWVPEESIYKWYTEQDGDETVLYANFQDLDPNREKVEINVRRRCFFPSETGRGWITLSGFVIEKAATTWAPPASFQDGMVGPHWSRGWIIEDCEIRFSKCAGISLGKYLDPENDQYFTHKHVKSPTQMERDAVCRGQYHGWTRENVGGHIVRRCNIHHCEQGGIIGRMGCVFSLIEDNHIHHINNMQELGGAEIAGIKLHAAIDVIFRRNHIHHCTMGIWCDWQAQGTRITQNLLHDNQAPEGAVKAPGTMANQDLFVEVSHGPTLIDNNVLLSKASLMMATQGVALVHNLILGSFVSVGAGVDQDIHGVNQPRYTPYHFPHRTEVMGFMSILHGDDRFYNNLFLQAWPVSPETESAGNMGFGSGRNEEVGTHVFDEYPTDEEWLSLFHMDRPANYFELLPAHFAKLPVRAAGNAYFGGAKAWKKEQGALVDGSSPVTVTLTEEDGRPVLRTNLYEFLGDYRCGVVTSDTLGVAFEPEERFETPEGETIVFDRDYFGAHRGVAPLPGPFAEGGAVIPLL